MQHVTLVNRTTRNLEGLWDGKHYTLAPGKHSFPDTLAMKFKDQNPVMGSLDPYTGRMDSLIGIEEYRDDCSPIEQSDAIEQWNRAAMGGPDVKVIKGKGGLFAEERHSILPGTTGLVASGFERP